MQTMLQNLSCFITGLVAVIGAALCLATSVGWLALLLKIRARLAAAEKQIAGLCL